MPASTVLPLISTGLQATSSVLNPLFQSGQNKQNQQFAENMYNRQRADALADREFQNQYNSPAAQMQRLKAAGLNPNLVYGNGNAVQQSAQTRSSDFSTPKTDAPQLNFQSTANSIMMGEQIKQMQVQTDNLKAAIEVAQQEKILKAAQTLNTVSQTEKTDVGTQIDKYNLNNSMPVSLKQAQLNLDKTISETQLNQTKKFVDLAENERKAAMAAPNLQAAIENVLLLRAQTAKTSAEKSEIYTKISNIKADTKIKNLDAELKAKGIQPHDALYQRFIAEFLQDNKGSIKENTNKVMTATSPSFMYNVMKAFFN